MGFQDHLIQRTSSYEWSIQYFEVEDVEISLCLKISILTFPYFAF